jgi:CBS domain-containing protein
MNDVTALARLDSFPYRHRLREVMQAPPLTASPDLSVEHAVARMHEARVSAIVIVDGLGRTAGIFTERDLLRLLTQTGPSALILPLDAAMSRPVATVSAQAFLHVALGKMARKGFRHLVAVDADNRPLGLVTSRDLLRLRAGDALALGDSVEEAQGAPDMARVVAALPSLAAGLLTEGIDARAIGAVIGATVRDLTARASQLAETSMIEDGWGPPPTRYAVLVLGSAGRGESLLAFDQDNALVHAGSESDDLWFAELGQRLTQILNDAGIPFCEGEVMARARQWRRSLEDWHNEIHRWVFSLENQTAMYCDIFYDFQPVWGDHALADALRAYAIEKASQSAFFLQYLARTVAAMDGAIGLFGQIVTRQGRINVKKYALLPLTAAARLRAIRAHIADTATDDRLAALRDQGLLHDEDYRDLVEIRETVTRAILEQQLADLKLGLAPSARIDPRRFDHHTRKRLRWAFQRLKTLKYVCGIGR